MSEFTVHKLTVGRWLENCYIIESKDNEAVIIDPGDEGDVIANYIIEKGIEPKAIVNTHAHYDHVGAVSELKEKFKIPFYLHSKDKRLLNHASIYRAFTGESIKFKVPEIDFFMDNVDELKLANLSLKIYYTPGHTEGSICILIGNKFFTGDYLLNTKIGRTDLPGADKNKFSESIKLITGFPLETVIYPGHGDISTIGNEINCNMELQKVMNAVQD